MSAVGVHLAETPQNQEPPRQEPVTQSILKVTLCRLRSSAVSEHDLMRVIVSR